MEKSDFYLYYNDAITVFYVVEYGWYKNGLISNIQVGSEEPLKEIMNFLKYNSDLISKFYNENEDN